MYLRMSQEHSIPIHKHKYTHTLYLKLPCLSILRTVKVKFYCFFASVCFVCNLLVLYIVSIIKEIFKV